MTALQRLITNGNRLITFLKDFSDSTAKDISLDWINDDGSIDTHTFSNIKKFQDSVTINTKETRVTEQIVQTMSKETPTTFLSMDFEPQQPNSVLLLQGVIWIAAGNRNANDFYLKCTQDGTESYIGATGISQTENDIALTKNSFIKASNWFHGAGTDFSNNTILPIPFNFRTQIESDEPITFELQCTGSGTLFLNRAYDNANLGSFVTNLIVAEFKS